MFRHIANVKVKAHYYICFKLRARSMQEHINMFYFRTSLWNKDFKYSGHEHSNSLLVMISVIRDEHMRTTCLLSFIVTNGPNGIREYGYLFQALVSCLNLILVFACVILGEVNLYNCFISLKVFNFTLKVFCALSRDVHMLQEVWQFLFKHT